jgi:uncharacterized protein (DUF433 family)
MSEAVMFTRAILAGGETSIMAPTPLNPILRGTGIRVQTIVVEFLDWQLSQAQIAEEHDLTLEQVEEALAFYRAHRSEIETSLAEEQRLESVHAPG